MSKAERQHPLPALKRSSQQLEAKFKKIAHVRPDGRLIGSEKNARLYMYVQWYIVHSLAVLQEGLEFCKFVIFT